MRAFKHVPAAFADAFERGEQIKIGTFGYYRALDGPRRDPLEGLAVSIPSPIIGDFDPGNPEQSAQDRALRSVGIVIEGAGVAIDLRAFGNRRISQVSEAYLFCCSSEPNWSLAENGQVIFEITDLGAFARELALSEPTLLGAPDVRRVTYAQRAVDTLYAEAPTPDPFIKDIACAGEKEIRIMWPLPASSSPVRVPSSKIVHCPAAAKFIQKL